MVIGIPTPLKCGFSPSELAMGRIRSFLPVTPSLLMPKTIDRDILFSREKERIRRQKEDFDHRYHRRKRDDLEVGDRVWIRDLRRWRVILKRADQPRSYIVQTDRGTYRRNRSHLHRLSIPLGYFEIPENTSNKKEQYTPSEKSSSPGEKQELHTPPTPKEEATEEEEATEKEVTNQRKAYPVRYRKKVSRLSYETLGGPKSSSLKQSGEARRKKEELNCVIE